MTLTVQRSLAIVAAIAVAGLAVAQAGKAASEAGAGTLGEWVCWDPDSPNPCRHDLNAVSIVSETDAWTVGDSGHVQRWDGRQWRAASSPCTGDVDAVDMLAHDDGWAICQMSVYHWNGMTWQRAWETVDDFFFVSTLDMHSSDYGWAALTAGDLHRWDGSRWHGPAASNLPYGIIEDIDVLSPRDAWAVLLSLSGGPDGPAIRWDGSRWTGVHIDVPDDTHFNGIAMATNTDGWIIGEENGEGNLAYRWNGSRWSRADLGPLGEMMGYDGPWYPALNSIHASGTGGVWVAGDWGTVGRFEGAAWSIMDGGTTSSLQDLEVVAPDHGWAVGRSGIASRWDGHQWTADGSADDATYHDIHLASGTDGWAVGEWSTRSEGTRAAVYRWNGVDWSLHDTFGNMRLNAVDFAGPTHGWAVGDAGTILYGDGTSWVQVESGTTSWLYDVAAVGRDDAWAVGGGGAVLHWDGEDWSAVDTPIPSSEASSVRAVDFVTPSDGWVSAGDAGDMLHWDGHEWTTYSAPVDCWTKDLLLVGPDDGWAVCSAGEILRWDGDNWAVGADLDAYLEVVAANGPDEVWAAGSLGNLFRWNGRAWSRAGSDTTKAIRSMAFSPGGDGWAGGYSQLMMRYGPEATATPAGPDPGPTPGGGGPNTIYAPDVDS